MRISNETLDAAFQRFGERQWTDSSVRELVSFIVDREIDYEAMETYLHATIYTARREEAMLDRDEIKWIVAQLIVCGIGGDDDTPVA